MRRSAEAAAGPAVRALLGTVASAALFWGVRELDPRAAAWVVLAAGLTVTVAWARATRIDKESTFRHFVEAMDLATLEARADAALYRAKRSGRGRIEVWTADQAKA